MTRYGMVIDLNRCTGCRACMTACKVENNTPQANFWMNVFRFEENEYPNTRVWFMPRPCMHCNNAACVKVCPTGARFKREDGLTLTDWERCIGCRYCEVACPYGVNYFNWKAPEENQYLDWDDAELVTELGNDGLPYANPDLELSYGPEDRFTAGGGHYKGVVEKCTFCVHRLENDLIPACADNCPTDVINFGDLDDPSSKVSMLLGEKPSYRLLEDVGTDPNVYYIGGTPPNSETRQIEEIKVRV
ncbi:MAG: 4Fe-4S dicluster domain-containing protein [Chloroflexi bacterium]|nr:4Fe-4S dicluster domain-containing protein [Chloroflexota bacterium]